MKILDLVWADVSGQNANFACIADDDNLPTTFDHVETSASHFGQKCGATHLTLNRNYGSANDSAAFDRLRRK